MLMRQCVYHDSLSDSLIDSLMMCDSIHLIFQQKCIVLSLMKEWCPIDTDNEFSRESIYPLIVIFALISWASSLFVIKDFCEIQREQKYTRIQMSIQNSSSHLSITIVYIGTRCNKSGSRNNNDSNNYGMLHIYNTYNKIRLAVFANND